MTAVADVFYGVAVLAGGSILSYFAGWVVCGAIDDISRFSAFLRRFMNGE